MPAPTAKTAEASDVPQPSCRKTAAHGEGREQRMRVLEVDALVADFRHRRRGLRRNNAPAQAVGHEQDQVARGGVLRGGRSSGKRDQSGGQQYDCAAHQVLPQKKQFRHSADAFRLVLLCDRIVTLWGTSLKSGNEGQGLHPQS